MKYCSKTVLGANQIFLEEGRQLAKYFLITNDDYV